MVTLGDKGAKVSQLQKLLSMIGYDLVIDGDFGAKTLRSLKAFQKKYGLVVDGIGGPNTFAALKAAQKRTAKEDKSNKYDKDYGDLEVDTNNHMGPEQYIKQEFDKDKLYLHFTVSGPDAKNVIRYWDGNSPRIATAYVVSGRGDEDGKVYEAFHPDYWSYHLGVKGTKGKLDKHSVGIEICTWGRLTKKGDKFYTVYGGQVSEDEVCVIEDKWRGDKYYHAYSDKQIDTLEELIVWIVKEYSIPVQNIDFDRDWLEYDESLIKDKTPGIYSHTNVRKDKQDVYPDQRLFDMLNKVKERINCNCHD